MGPARDQISDVMSFQKLIGSNYHMWSEQMQAALEARVLWLGYIEHEVPPALKPSENPPKKSVTSKLGGATEPITPSKPQTGGKKQSFAAVTLGGPSSGAIEGSGSAKPKDE